MVRSGSLTQFVIPGLTYETPTQSGVIDETSTFTFVAGETATLKLGETVIGTFTADTSIAFTEWMSDIIPLTNAEVLRIAERERGPGVFFLNLASLLLTLDADGSCANGIQIPSRVLELLDGVELPLHHRFNDFWQSGPYRRLIRDCLAEDVWGTAGRPLFHPMKALDEIYGKLGIPHRFRRRARYRVDDDADGSWDRAYLTLYAPDELTSTYETDTGFDATIDARTVVTYDALGYLRRLDTDDDADNVVDQVLVQGRNASGYETLTTRYTSGVKTSEAIYTLDGLGLEIVDERDDDGDGTVDSRTTLTRDAEGRRLTRASDLNADGTAESLSSYTYDAQGREIRWETDDDVDGSLDFVTTTSYDDQDRVVEQTFDNEGDGTVDQVIRTTYNDVSRTSTTLNDSDDDGTPDQITHRTRDALGRLILLTSDFDGDGTIDRRETWTYTPLGELHERDTNADGTIDERTTTTTDADGNPLRRETDSNADGTADRIEDWLWEAGSAFQSPAGQGE